MDGKHISFAGAGRVGASLCRQLYNSGYMIDLVVSEKGTSAENLAESVKCDWSDVAEFPESTDIIFVAVPDHSLENVLNNIVCSNNSIVVHTAGSYGLDVFPSRRKKKGVFYPLQTFSVDRMINFREVPLLLESDDDEVSAVLYGLASSVSDNVSFVDTEKRRLIHLAAVFTCNFTNHMLAAGSKIVSEAGFSSEILGPLIKETVFKALGSDPADMQTGPAVRHDFNTIDKHIEMLSSSPGLQNLYRSVTQSIIDFYKSKESDQF